MDELRASASGTATYRDRFKGLVDESHFRESGGLTLSSIGLGTYLGHHDEQTDQSYAGAIKRALELGVNVVDTAANYRFQRSERVIGEVLASLIADGKIARDEIVIATKGGYVPFDGAPPGSRKEMNDYLERTFVQSGICTRDDFVQNSHSMAPRYLAHQLEQSLRNLKVRTIDIYYVHNPEAQFAGVDREVFRTRLRAAFEFLESAASEGLIAKYGVATWNGFRVAPSSPEFLSLLELVETAREVAGDDHHFGVVQLPLNLAMREALTLANQPLEDTHVPLLEAANEFGVTVMSSATLLQSRLASGLPETVAESFAGVATDAQRAIQFARSAPGVATALIGMARASHVEENLLVSRIPRATMAAYIKLFGGLGE
ncbi:MAG: aldo/keto reductase [Acidobacteriota bacterium]